jgi:N-acetylmuramoyl-L-alanine amidase
MREEEWLRAGGDALAGRVVVVDPGHGDGDPGSHDGSLREADLMLDLARRLEGRLGALGVTAYLTRGPDGAPSDEDRAAFANSAGADLLVSLHCDAAPSVRCNGAATFYFGGARGGSATGERLAGLVQREIAARTAMLDCGTHPKTWDLLRLTRMPAIRLEVGYLSNPEDRARLTDPRFRDTVAEAIVVSIKRLYLPRDLDATTGELHLSVLAS